MRDENIVNTLLYDTGTEGPAEFMPGLLFYPEDGGSMFLRNVGDDPQNCMASHFRR
jgi:hypothetical protein